MIKNIIFDVGGVLLDYRWQGMLMDYGLSESEAYRVGHELFDDPEDLWGQFDLDIMPDSEVIGRFCRKHPDDADAITWFITHCEYMPTARPEIWKRIPLLKKKGYHVYILSNYSESFFKKHTEYADFIPEMDGILVSYMIHKVKPDPIIYEELCRRYHLNPEECIFFDDRQENVDGAIACGMQSVRVTGRAQFAAELDKFLA